MKKVVVFFMMICLTFNVSAQLLWKVSDNGLDKPSYLFGTHHLVSLKILDDISGLQDAFSGATHVATELLMEEMMSQESMIRMQQQMFIENDTTLKALLTPEEFERVNNFTRENLMLDLEMAPKLKPSFINNNVVIALYMKNIPDFNPQEQLDLYFQQKGIEQNKKISAFETMEFQMNLLFNGQSLQRQAELLVCALKDTDRTFDAAKRLTEAYMAQDINALYELSKERAGDNCDPLPGEMEAMLDNRNVRWMESLPGMMKESSVFVVVGALHLAGEKGLINLLKEQGYSVEPVL